MAICTTQKRVNLSCYTGEFLYDCGIKVAWPNIYVIYVHAKHSKVTVINQIDADKLHILFIFNKFGTYSGGALKIPTPPANLVGPPNAAD